MSEIKTNKMGSKGVYISGKCFLCNMVCFSYSRISCLCGSYIFSNSYEEKENRGYGIGYRTA